MNRIRAKKDAPKETPKTYGLLAKFERQEDLIAAVNRAYEAGYRDLDAYTPYPVEELSRALRLKSSPLPYLIAAGGAMGALSGFAMQAYAQAIDYPQNIGGRPMLSWPAYIPITFELTILLAALAGVLGLFVLTRLPQPYHPLFNSEDFNEHGSQDAFYLGIEAKDPKFDLQNTRQFMESLGSPLVSEIEA